MQVNTNELYKLSQKDFSTLVDLVRQEQQSRQADRRNEVLENLRIGSTVSFLGRRYQGRLYGKVQKINKKTVTVVNTKDGLGNPGGNWRVGFSQLRVVED